MVELNAVVRFLVDNEVPKLWPKVIFIFMEIAAGHDLKNCLKQRFETIILVWFVSYYPVLRIHTFIIGKMEELNVVLLIFVICMSTNIKCIIFIPVTVVWWRSFYSLTHIDSLDWTNTIHMIKIEKGEYDTSINSHQSSSHET